MPALARCLSSLHAALHEQLRELLGLGVGEADRLLATREPVAADRVRQRALQLGEERREGAHLLADAHRLRLHGD